MAARVCSSLMQACNKSVATRFYLQSRFMRQTPALFSDKLFVVKCLEKVAYCITYNSRYSVLLLTYSILLMLDTISSNIIFYMYKYICICIFLEIVCLCICTSV